MGIGFDLAILNYILSDDYELSNPNPGIYVLETYAEAGLMVNNQWGIRAGINPNGRSAFLYSDLVADDQTNGALSALTLLNPSLRFFLNFNFEP